MTMTQERYALRIEDLKDRISRARSRAMTEQDAQLPNMMVITAMTNLALMYRQMMDEALEVMGKS